jgi:3-dehydrosphinganine reductase
MSNRSVIVTGGSSGIGLATALAFAAAGDHVAVVARNAPRLETAAQRLCDACPSAEQRIAWKSADLSDFTATRAAFDELASEGFAPDVLINSAGVIYPGEFATMPLSDFEDNITHGFWSVVYPCRAVAPAMVERGAGHIVNVSSVAGYLGIYGYTGYSASKYAVMGFTEALRCEMKPAGVRVSVVCPPDTDTPALSLEHTMRPPETHAIAGNIKPVSAEKVAAAILKAVDRGTFLVIPDALSAFYFRLKGLLPEVFYTIVDGDVMKVRKDH